MEHSIIAASSGYIWGKPEGCTGWALMSQMHPEEKESQEAKDGTASHEIGKDIIDLYTRGMTPSFSKFEGKTAANGVLFTEEMYDCAKIYADDVLQVMREHRVYGGEYFATEQRLECKSIHDLAFGTPDQWLYANKDLHLYLWDYKFGHLLVEEFENWQLLVYLSGILDKLKVNGLLDQAITVHFRIIQPRAYHRRGTIREWKFKASEARPYFNILSANAHEALGPNPVTRSGSHCRYCSARHNCETALRAGISLYDVASQPTPLNMSPAAVGVQLGIVKRAIKQLEGIETGLTEHAKHLLRSGQCVPGFNMQPKLGKEVWTSSNETVIALGESLGHDLRKKGVKTPKQARDLGINADVIKQFTKREPSVELTQDDGSKARRIFK